MKRLFTSESVSSGHPDKIADQISDAVLDEFLKQDREAKVACETFITDGLVIVGGEAHAEAYVDIQETARKVIKDIGYTPEYCFDPNNCGVITTLHAQSPDIRMGVEKEGEQGAGDQGIMFGYACRESSHYMPATISLAHDILSKMENLRKNEELKGYGPDAKSQVTIEYLDGKPSRIDTILISTQHHESKSIDEIRAEIKDIVLPDVLKSFECLNYDDYKLLVNPTGRFVIGGPKGDTGLTGRKIIIDTYGGRGAHGGGAFSGKDPSKVDRSGAYMARWMAKNVLTNVPECRECLVQLSYAIGIAQPISIYVKTDLGESADMMLSEYFMDHRADFTPGKIIERFNLKSPIYFQTASYGHFGRPCFERNGLTYFPWEKTEKIDFNI